MGARVHTWHPGLPDPPANFPESDGLSMRLTPEEAEFIQDRVSTAHPDSFLAALFLHGEPVDTEFPWEHPIWSELGKRHREELRHARLFSQIAEGATLLYNLLVARKAGRRTEADEYEADLAAWEASLDREELAAWSMDRLWELTEDQGHTIALGARTFVVSWTELCSSGASLAEDPEAARLVRTREERLKGARSRFTNQAARDRWGGSSGLGRMNYRWPEVKTFVEDLHTALEEA